MQLLEIVLYSHAGEKRVVEFRQSALNIITGESRTGKSALLSIVEYCLGRSSPHTPSGPITETVAWFGCLWALPSGARAFTARPGLASAASTQRAMITLAGNDLVSPRFDELEVNADRDSLRRVIGEQLGLIEVQVDAAGRDPYAITLGSAALFCFQRQDEIANQTLLFHRQGDPQMAQVLKDAFPYYLGAVAGDEARKRRQLRVARQVLRRSEWALAAAQRDVDESGSALRALILEASAAGLVRIDADADLATLVQVLSEVRSRVAPAPTADRDIEAQNRQRELSDQRLQTQRSLTQLLRDRDALLEESTGAEGYSKALSAQVGRLSSIELITEADGDAVACPVCGSDVTHSDAAVGLLEERLQGLREELVDLASSIPNVAHALEELESRIRSTRAHLDTLNLALASLVGSQSIEEVVTASAQQDFIRGRIDATLSRYSNGEETNLVALQAAQAAAAERVTALEAEVGSDRAREQLTSRLAAVGRDMTRFATNLELEHSDRVRLDVTNLTVVADTDTGPISLQGIGSAANWIGYHLVAHLALHRYFVRQRRPVPHFLMLDQPTQAYYQPEAQPNEGASTPDEDNDPDREAVLAMFKLMYDVVAELAPNFQVIVSDHANLSVQWFQESVVHNWRGDALIPEHWYREQAPASPTEA